MSDINETLKILNSLVSIMQILIFLLSLLTFVDCIFLLIRISKFKAKQKLGLREVKNG